MDPIEPINKPRVQVVITEVDGLGARFAEELISYAAAIDALREVGDLVLPQVLALDPPPRSTLDQIFEKLTEPEHSDRKEVVESLLRRFQEVGRNLEDAPQSDGPTELGLTTESLQTALSEFFSSLGEDTLSAVLSMQRRHTPRTGLLLTGLVSVLTSAFENLLGAIADLRFRHSPASMGTAEREFSLDDLRAFESIEDAIDHSVQTRVDALLRGSLSDWEAWFKRVGVEMPPLAIDWDEAREVFLRRNVLIHNSAKASRQYVQSLPDSFDKVAVGEDLSIDESYLLNAVDHLDVLGHLLLTAVWVKFEKSDSDKAGSAILSRQYELLKLGRWRATRQLGSILQGMACKDALRSSAKANTWLSIKQTDGLDSVEKEVRAWDVSALAPKYILVKHVLLEELDRAFAMLPEMLDRKDLDLDELQDWPIFEAVRQDPRYNELPKPSESSPSPEP